MKIKELINKIPSYYYFILLAILFIPAYIYGRSILIDQITYFLAYDSKLTINIILLFGLAGKYVSIYTKGMSKIKGWAIWFIVILTLVMFFKYVGGLETIW